MPVRLHSPPVALFFFVAFASITSCGNNERQSNPIENTADSGTMENGDSGQETAPKGLLSVEPNARNHLPLTFDANNTIWPARIPIELQNRGAERLVLRNHRLVPHRVSLTRALLIKKSETYTSTISPSGSTFLELVVEKNDEVDAFAGYLAIESTDPTSPTYIPVTGALSLPDVEVSAQKVQETGTRHASEITIKNTFALPIHAYIEIAECHGIDGLLRPCTADIPVAGKDHAILLEPQQAKSIGQFGWRPASDDPTDIVLRIRALEWENWSAGVLSLNVAGESPFVERPPGR